MLLLTTVISFKDTTDGMYKMGEVFVRVNSKMIKIIIDAEGFSEPLLSSHIQSPEFLDYLYDMFGYEEFTLRYQYGSEILEYIVEDR